MCLEMYFRTYLKSHKEVVTHLHLKKCLKNENTSLNFGDISPNYTKTQYFII